MKTLTAGMSSRSERAAQTTRVVIVSEDPAFIEEVRGELEDASTKIVACLGPTASPCHLDDKQACPLVGRSQIVLIDAPAGGYFRRHWKQVAAWDYADRLQKAHPLSLVVLATNGGDFRGGGEEVVVRQRETALLFLKWALPAFGGCDSSGAVPARGLAALLGRP